MTVAHPRLHVILGIQMHACYHTYINIVYIYIYKHMIIVYIRITYMDPEDDVETWDPNARLLSYIYKYSIYIRITHNNIEYIHIWIPRMT